MGHWILHTSITQVGEAALRGARVDARQLGNTLPAQVLGFFPLELTAQRDCMLRTVLINGFTVWGVTFRAVTVSLYCRKAAVDTPAV